MQTPKRPLEFLIIAIAFIALITIWQRTSSAKVDESRSATSPSSVFRYAVPNTLRSENNLLLRLNGPNLELLDGQSGATLRSQRLDTTRAVDIEGVDGGVNDTLTVDLTGGKLAPLSGIHFNGGVGGFDTLVIKEDHVDTVVFNYLPDTPTAGHNGSIVIDGTVISYENIEPITNTGTAADAIFNLPAGTVGASLEDDGTPGNNTVRLRSTNATFETTTFTVPTNSLTINAGGGTDTISTAADFSGDFNVGLTINGTIATDTINLNALTLNAGSAKLIATGNSVNQTAGTLTASKMALQDSTGLGTGGTHMLTQVSNLVARTSVGGIFIDNTGDVNIGFAGDPFQGVRITGASGDISLGETGNLNVTTNAENIRGPGNITVNATGDITTGNQSATSAIFSTNTGDVSVTAGNNLNLGTVGTIGDVGANNGTLSLQATSGNITLDNNTAAFANGAAQFISAIAGGNISFLATTVAGSNIDSNGGDIVLVTGPGGTFNLNSGAGGHIASGPFYVAANGGNIGIAADRMSINDPISAAGTSSTGIIQLDIATGGRPIDLGTNANVTHLGLLQTDLNNLTASVLRIGDLSTGGNLTVTAPITDVGTGWNTLSLLTPIGAGISQSAGATLTVPNLNAAGNTGVTLNENNVVSKLAGASEFGAFSFTDATNLALDNVDNGLGFVFGSGIVTEARPVNLTVNVLNDSLTINQNINTTVSFSLPASAGANVNLVADNMALNNNSPNSSINGGTGGVVTLKPFTSGNVIQIGGADAAGVLGIDDNDLANITGASIHVGSAAQAGDIDEAGIVNTHAGYNTMEIITPGNLTRISGSLSVQNLLFTNSASAISRTYNINNGTSGANAFKQSANNPILYSTTTNLTISGGTAADTFNVTPSSTTTFNFNGNDPPPPASPGDSLNVNTAGTTNVLLTKNSTPSGFQGQYTFGNRQPINFTTMETLNPSCAQPPPTISCPASISKFTDSGQSTATVNPGTAVSSGGCSPVKITGARSDGKPLNAPYPVGVTTITWTATDASNKTSSCGQTIVVMVPSGDRRKP